MAMRFGQYLPVVVDVETGGLNPKRDALLEIAAITLELDENNFLKPKDTYTTHVEAFEGANIDPEALAINGIKPFHPFRFALKEDVALQEMHDMINANLKETGCQRAVLVGHNATFDLSFIMEATNRQKMSSPFHKFTCFDTATLAGLAFQETVLARALRKAGIKFNPKDAHSALYDTEKTAELFCKIVNMWQQVHKPG